MKITRSVLIIIAGCLLAVSGCNLEKATPTVVTKGGGGGCGTPDAPIQTHPLMWAILDDLKPALSWGYQNANCYPDSYLVHLRTGPFFQDDLGSSSNVASWVPANDLQPGSEYAWGVQAVDNGLTGPYAGERYFFTGPMCSADNMKAVSLLSPLNNWTVHDLNDLTLTWDYPDECLPEYYWVGLTTNLDFNGSPLSGSTGNPSTRWAPGDPLTDCTRYYWMVRPGIGDSLGPYSQVYTFRVEISGGCPPEVQSMIGGTVWDDQCVNPGPGIPDPLPLGCVLNGEQIWTNGTYDPGEPGIPGPIVSLNQGACPSTTTLRDVPAGPDGTYHFYMVTAGTYCLSIDSTYGLNSPNLLPGNWTYPLESAGQTLASQTVTVGAGEQANNVNFGWWYKMGTPWGDTSATVFGQVWSDLCVYHPGDPVPDPLPAGCVNDAFGVHADKVKQAGEAGIAGITVDIGPGDCPSAGLATAVTDTNGYYYFSGLAAGKYCLRIDPDHGSPNEPLLMPGQWTVIPSGHEGMSFRAITLTANHTLPGQDFGWDYDEAVPTLEPTITLEPTFTSTFTLEPTFTPTLLPAEPPFLTLDVNAYCRKGPGPQFEAVTNGLAGKSYHIEAVSADDNWVRVRFDDTLRCWMGKGTGAIFGSLEQVPRVFVPTDTPTAVRYCAQFTTQRQCIAHGSAGCAWLILSNTAYCAGP